MKKNIIIAGVLFSVFIAQSVFALDSFTEDNTAVEGTDTTPVGTPSFTEDNTAVEGTDTTPVGTPSFTEDNTAVESTGTVPVGTPSFTEDNTAVEGTDTPVVETPEETVTTSNSNRGRSGGSRRTTNAPAGNLASGEVLGASTDAGSCKLLTTYMKIGQENNVEEVKALQTFLNTKINAGLPVTGFFGPLTLQAVKNFQIQYKEEILKPWTEAGLMADIVATGYVYKTTLYTINKMLCPEAVIEAPLLN